jgi:hypothetical protein
MVVEAKNLPDKLSDEDKVWEHALGGSDFMNIITINDGKAYCGMNGKTLPSKEKRKGGPGLLILDVKTGNILFEDIPATVASFGLSDVPIIENGRIYLRNLCMDMKGKEIFRYSTVMNRYYNTMHGPNGTGIIIGDYLWVPTSFSPGADLGNWEEISVERPWHPNVTVFDKNTGKLVATDDVQIQYEQHGSWIHSHRVRLTGKILYFGDLQTAIATHLKCRNSKRIAIK